MDRATYLLPIKSDVLENTNELTAYLRFLSSVVDIVIVDGSEGPVFASHASEWSGLALHIAPDPSIPGLNGKARGVLSGLRRIVSEKIIIADDDVRYDERSIWLVLEALSSYDVVRPQNYFAPRTWHTLLDSGRTLLNRISGGDWPGTLGVRRDAIIDGYNAHVLFENFELVEAVKARGGREHVAYDIFVPRLPPTTEHFLSQRVRQAYDEFARPLRLGAALSVLPLLLTALAARRPHLIIAGVLAAITCAEAGRRRARAMRHFPFVASVAAPVWVLERGVCVWIALCMRVRYGGIPYAGSVIRDAATPSRKRRGEAA